MKNPFRRRNVLSDSVADTVRHLSDLPLNKGVQFLIQRLHDAETENDRLSDRLHEMQTTVEVQAQAMQRDAAELEQHIGRLRDAVGDPKAETEAEVLASIRANRELAERVRLFNDVVQGRFDADVQLRRRLACALGVATFDERELINRAGVLGGFRSRALMVEHELRQQIADLKERLDDEIDVG